MSSMSMKRRCNASMDHWTYTFTWFQWCRWRRERLWWACRWYLFFIFHVYSHIHWQLVAQTVNASCKYNLYVNLTQKRHSNRNDSLVAYYFCQAKRMTKPNFKWIFKYLYIVIDFLSATGFLFIYFDSLLVLVFIWFIYALKFVFVFVFYHFWLAVYLFAG